MTKTTLEHVAQKAQVSISTVSRVLNGKTGVNEGTRRRILSILASTDYGSRVPQAAGAGNRVLGLLVPVAAQQWGMQSNFVQESLQAITDTARQSNYVTMVGAFHPDLSDRIEDRMIMERQFAGVLLFRTRDEELDSKPFRDYDIPYIVVNRLLPGTQIHYLGVDHREVSCQATEYLIGCGYRNIAMLAGDPQYVSHDLYRRGFLDAHQAAGLLADPSLMETIELRAEEGYSGTERLMRGPRRPDALILPSDRSAIGALKALRDLGVRVPEDIGVMVLDGTIENAFANPPLTAVEVPWYDMLALGTTLLIKMVEDRPAIENIGIRFSTRLVVRDSTRTRKRLD
jgi:LacI family xylobiose transport system transcriptional regulator